MSNGGSIYHVDINTIHPSNVLLFKNINRILGYKLSGIDYLGDITVPYDLFGSVLEVNANPGIGPHYNVANNKSDFLTTIINTLFK